MTYARRQIVKEIRHSTYITVRQCISATCQFKI